MQIEVENEGDWLVIRLKEARLDAHIAGEFKDKVRRSIDAGHRRIILNLGATTFIDSAGLGAIVAALKSVGKEGRIDICGLQESALAMFKLTRMDKVFALHATEADALAG